MKLYLLYFFKIHFAVHDLKLLLLLTLQNLTSMSFLDKKRLGEKDLDYCRIHAQRIVQLGNCLTCSTICAICEGKNCIKHHEESQRIHNVVTIEYVRHIVREYLYSDQNKKSVLKKMIADYFTEAKKQLQELYNEIYQSVDLFQFDNIILREDEKIIVEKLIQENYNELSCSDIAIILPKLIKCSNYEDGHFGHLRDYLHNEKQKINRIFDEMILNLPYFRENMAKRKDKEFVEISSEWLREVNEKLKEINFKPKKLRVRYIDDEGEEEQKRQFIRNLCTIDKLTNLQQFQIYCLWDVRDQDFQVAFLEAMMRYPYLKSLSIYTGYQVTDASFIDEVVDQGTLQVRVYKQDWKF